MVSSVVSRVVILVFGTLYPAYASYKAVRTKNVKEYVKWMMYWIVFALFMCVETFSDVFLSWLPFYYEVKIVFVLWLLSPVTKGSSVMYKKFVHPQLVKREKEIDEAIAKASKRGYSALLTLGTRGLTYATTAVVTTAIKGQSKLVDHIRKSYSTSDLRVPEQSILDRSNSMSDVTDEDELDNRIAEDNRELEKRKEKKKLIRSHSDERDQRPALKRSSKSTSGLSSLQEEDNEEEITFTEEIYYAPKSYLNQKENRSDPYGTMPRTRSKNRERAKIPY
ncbi:hypothetical protein ScPMuIL_000531 [Solemya velum]